MKQTDNRQNKLHQLKAQTQPFPKGNPAAKADEHLSGPAHPPHVGGIIYGLVRDLLVATKIAQAAKHCHLAVHNFDRAEPLVAHAKNHKPALVILDWDGCEAEAFKVLKEMNGNADLKMVPNVGYLSQSKSMVRDEARQAGCHRVYTKTEFMHDLETLVARYSL
jgi:hypothetical protein